MADKESDNGNLLESLEYINNAISITPKRSILYLKKALYYEGIQDYKLALNAIDTSIYFCDTISTSFSIKADILTHLNLMDSAIVYHSKAIQMLPNNPGNILNRGLMYYELGQFEKAISDYNKALSVDSTYYSAYFYKGQIQAVVNKDFANAISDYTQLIDNFKPKNLTDNLFLASAYIMRGTCYDLTMKNSLACEDWNEGKRLGHKAANKYIIDKCNE